MILQAKFNETSHIINGKFGTNVSVVDGYNDGYVDGYDDGWNDGINDGYTDGYNNGVLEGFDSGKQAEYDRFWDTLQEKGKRVNNSYLCCNSSWDDIS